MNKMTMSIGVAGALTAVVIFMNKKRKEKRSADVLKSNRVQKVGRPNDEEDAKMVSEGALTSIRYFNEWQDKNELKRKKA